MRENPPDHLGEHSNKMSCIELVPSFALRRPLNVDAFVIVLKQNPRMKIVLLSFAVSDRRRCRPRATNRVGSPFHAGRPPVLWLFSYLFSNNYNGRLSCPPVVPAPGE